MFVRFVRPPHTSGYNFVDVREDAIITLALGYFKAVGFEEYDVCDFHLDRSLTFNRLLDGRADCFIITVRETGANVHYALRVASALVQRSTARIILYGQTGRLKALQSIPPGIDIVPHDETALASALGLPVHGPNFAGALNAEPYFQAIPLEDCQSSRRKGSIESSRGCHYPCSFCFINHGINYANRWSLRPNERVLRDIQRYAELNIRNFVIHDSEFFGGQSRHYPDRRQLLQSMAGLPSPVRSMIFARADTLERFGDYQLIADAGITQIFIGVESLSYTDRLSLGKNVADTSILSAIHSCVQHGIGLNLSFMLFNRATTIDSLRANVTVLKQLAGLRDRHLLGIPNFLFSFESDWSASTLHDLSDRTYLRWMVQKRAQPVAGVAFDARLEPLVEICRLAFFELACKVTAVNFAMDDASEAEQDMIDAWFDGLWPFSVAILELFVERFAMSELTNATLARMIEDLFCLLVAHHGNLPPRLRKLETLTHAEQIAGAQTPIPLEDHGWDTVLPGGVVTGMAQWRTL